MVTSKDDPGLEARAQLEHQLKQVPTPLRKWLLMRWGGLNIILSTGHLDKSNFVSVYMTKVTYHKISTLLYPEISLGYICMKDVLHNIKLQTMCVKSVKSPSLWF